MLNAIATRLDAFSGTSEASRGLGGFHLAIRQGRHEDALRLALRHPGLVHMPDATGNTALHWAALGEFGHPARFAQREPGRPLVAEPGCYVVLAARLLELGAVPDVRNDQGQTPLHLAVGRARDVTVAHLLLERGADPMAIDANGDTALHVAVYEPPHALELVTLVRQCAGPGALRARNYHGQTPYDIANAEPASTARGALLAALRAPSVPRNAVAQPSEAPAPPDPPWAIALRMVRVALAQAASGPERPRVKAIFSLLPPLVTGLPVIAARQDATQILTALLGHLVELIAHCGPDDVVRAMKLLRGMCAQAPGLLDQQPLAWRLYLGYAALLRRANQWPEAVAYAGRAHGLAAERKDSAAAAQIDAALDDIELAALQHHFQYWAGAVLADYQAALHNMETKWRDTDDLIEAMQCAAAQLRSIERARDNLLRHGASRLAQGFAELAHYMAVPALDARIADALSVARQKQDKAVAFRALAAAILALARETARHGLAAYGAAWCAAVANAVADRSSAADVHQYPCGPHLEATEALQLVEPAAQFYPVGAPPPVPAPPGNWRSYRQALAALRQRVANAFAALPALPAAPHPTLSDWQAALPIEALQQRLTMDLTLLIGSIIEVCMGPMLVQPPLAFAVLGLGSMSRADMGPYSDLEYAVVVAHPLVPETLAHAWFQQWRARFEFAVFSLGESSPGGDHPLTVRRGLYLDPGPAAITAQHVLMETPHALADRLRARHLANRNDSGHTDQDVAFSLLTPCLAYGSEALARDYTAALTRVLDVRQSPRAGAFPSTARQDMALRQLHADVRHLGASHQSDPATVNLKKQFAGPLDHALTILAQLYGYAARQPREILARLAVSRRFAPAFLADYRWALATVQTIRLRTHLRHACHHDEVAWDSLPPDDAAALDVIEVRVVRPLWRAMGHWLDYHDYPKNGPSALLEYLHGLGNCDPALLAFEAARESDIGGGVDGAPSVTPEAVESLVATLVHRQTDAAALTEYYCRAMARTPRSQYEPTWTIWREGLKARADAADLIAALAALPCGDGWRGQWADAQRAFHRRVGSWLADVGPAAAQDRDFAIELPSMNRDPHGPAPIRRRVLRTDIATQVFHADGTIRPKPTGQRGRHTLLPVRFDADGERLTYWIKIAPENAPLETLVHALDRRVSGGSGTPCSMICKLETYLGSVAALVMEGAGDQDEDLDTLLRHAPSALRGLNLASFTRALLRVMLTNPEDDKADDYFVRPDANGHLHLRRVDNERAFFAPEERRLLGPNRLQVKSQLYCLDHMHAPLDAAVLRDFCKLAPVRLVQSWLVEAQVLHADYRNLFTDEEIDAHLTRDMPSLLAVGIAEGLEQELVKRIDSIQGVIRLGEHDHTTVSGMTLLSLVQRELARHYEGAFRAFPVDAHRPAAAIERFRMLTDSSYSVNARGERRSEMSGINAVSRSLNLSTPLRMRDVRAMAGGRFLSPAQALDRLQALEGRRVHDIVAGVLVGKRGDRLRFATLPVRHRGEALAAVHAGLLRNPAAYTPSVQERMLRAVAGVPFQELALTGFAAVLTDDLLAPLLRGAGDTLRSIDLSGCWQLTQDSMVTLAEECGRLGALRIRGLNPPGGGAHAPLKALRKPLLSVGMLRLPQLRTLDAGDCLHLGDIRIDAPRLATLAIDGCTELLCVRTGSRALTTLDARHCAALSEAALAAITPAWSGMQSVQLQGCARLRHTAFRERYPWIADWPWNTWTSTQMARWEASMGAALAASREQAGILPRERLRTWLDTREMVVRHMSDAVARATTLQLRFALMRALDADGDRNDDEGGAGADQHPPQRDRVQAPDAAAAFDHASTSQSLRAIPDADVGTHLTRLRSDDWQIRMAAARRLGKAGASVPDRAIHALLTALRDREEAVVVAAATALSRMAIWPSSQALLALLQPQDASSAHPGASV